MKAMIFRAVVLTVLIVEAACFAGSVSAQQAAIPDVDFRWAFAVFSTQDGKNTVRPVTQDLVLNSGDRLKMMVELQRRCYVYLFHGNSREGLKLLFPYTFQQFAADYQPNRKYYIPRGEGWFKLDGNPGEEVFYLLASAERLNSLEEAYLRHESAVGAQQKADSAKAVLDLIRALRREHRELAAPAERPVPIGGAVRGVQKIDDAVRFDVAAFADEILSTRFVARTFTIEHK